MKIFNGLKEKQAVFFNGKYVVQLPRGKFLDSSGNYLPGGQAVVEDLDIQKEIDSPAKVQKYIFADGTEKTPEDYKAIIKEIEQYEDEWGEPIYPSIEVEFDIRKRLQEFQTAEKVYYKPPIYYEPVEIEVIGSAEDTGSSFIETPFRHGEVTWKPKTGVYKLYTTAVSLDQWEKEKARNSEHSFHNKGLGEKKYGKLEFARIDNSFVFTSIRNMSFVSREGAVEIFTSLDEAKTREEEVRRLVKREVYKHISTNIPNERTLGEIIQQIEHVEKKVRTVESKQKTQKEHRLAIKSINDLIDSLKKQLEE